MGAAESGVEAKGAGGASEGLLRLDGVDRFV